MRRKMACVSVGVAAAVLGLALALGAHPLLRYIIRTQVTLAPGSPSEPFWEVLPEPLSTNVYLFDVLNAGAFASGADEKPKLAEVGPFAYDEFRRKVRIAWNEANGSVTYEQRRTFVERRNGSFDDAVTVVNAPAAMLSSLAASASKAERVGLNLLTSLIGEKLFVSKKPRKIIFDGYSDPILTAAEKLAAIGIRFPGETDKFGIFYGRNNSDWFDGVFNIHTGRKDLAMANKMNSWNFTDHAFFPGKCGEVRGNAELFTPYLDADWVEMYSNDLCRPIRLHYMGWQGVKGVQGKRFEMLPSFLANGTTNPDNACFEGESGGSPGGVFNASACRFGAPVFISQPHFYQADPFYLDQLQDGGGGLNPSKENHSTYFVIDPVSGIPLEVVARFQVNFYLQPVPGVKMFERLKRPIYFPAFWFETKMVLADGMRTKMWILSNFAPAAVIAGALLSAASTLLVVAVLVADWFWICRARRDVKDDDEDNILNATASSTEPLVQEEAPARPMVA